MIKLLAIFVIIKRYVKMIIQLQVCKNFKKCLIKYIVILFLY